MSATFTRQDELNGGRARDEAIMRSVLSHCDALWRARARRRRITAPFARRRARQVPGAGTERVRALCRRRSLREATQWQAGAADDDGGGRLQAQRVDSGRQRAAVRRVGPHHGPAEVSSDGRGLRRVRAQVESEAWPVWPASAAQAAGWPRLAEAHGSLAHDLAPREASGEPAGRRLCHLVFDAGASLTAPRRVRAARRWCTRGTRSARPA